MSSGFPTWLGSFVQVLLSGHGFMTVRRPLRVQTLSSFLLTSPSNLCSFPPPHRIQGTLKGCNKYVNARIRTFSYRSLQRRRYYRCGLIFRLRLPCDNRCGLALLGAANQRSRIVVRGLVDPCRARVLLEMMFRGKTDTFEGV